MSESKRPFGPDIVINDKLKGIIGRHSRYCGIFDNNLQQIHPVCLWKSFKIANIWRS